MDMTKFDKCLALALDPSATENEAINAFLAARKIKINESEAKKTVKKEQPKTQPEEKSFRKLYKTELKCHIKFQQSALDDIQNLFRQSRGELISVQYNNREKKFLIIFSADPKDAGDFGIVFNSFELKLELKEKSMNIFEKLYYIIF